MKIKGTCFFIFFSCLIGLNAMKIQTIGECAEDLKICSFVQLKSFAYFYPEYIPKIISNPFPIKTAQDVINFSSLCSNWSIWNVFSEEEFYAGNGGWLHHASYIKGINFKMPIIIWQPLAETQKPYLAFDIPVFEGLQFEDRASIDIPEAVKVHTQQLAFLNESNLYYYLDQGHSCDSLLLLASDWMHSLLDRECTLNLPQNLSERMQKLSIPLIALGDGCFKNNIKLKKVILNQIKHLQNDNFSNCIELTEVEADDLESIGDYCFTNCPNLKKVHLKNLRTIGDFCFVSFYSLRTIDDPLEITVGSDEGFTVLTQMLEKNADVLQIPIVVYVEK